MTPPAPTRYDLRWPPAGQAVLVLCCAAFGAVLALRHAGRAVRAGEPIPVDRRRAAAVAERVDPNLAGIGSLLRLPAIGRIRAEAILAYRAAHGPRAFGCAEDLAAVKGIGPATVLRVAPYLSLPLRATARTQPLARPAGGPSAVP
jgi:hypothetical protein